MAANASVVSDTDIDHDNGHDDVGMQDVPARGPGSQGASPGLESSVQGAAPSQPTDRETAPGSPADAGGLCSYHEPSVAATTAAGSSTSADDAGDGSWLTQAQVPPSGDASTDYEYDPAAWVSARHCKPKFYLNAANLHPVPGHDLFDEVMRSTQQEDDDNGRPSSLHTSPSRGSSGSSHKTVTRASDGQPDEEPGCWDEAMFVSPPSELLRCPICTQVMKDAVQCPSQHAFGRCCLKRALQYDPRCPICKTDFTFDQAAPCRFVRSFVERLTVRCENADAGCTAEACISSYNNHLDQCDFDLVACPFQGCNTVVRRNQSRSHHKTCPHALVRCMRCDETYTRLRAPQHSCASVLTSRVGTTATAVHNLYDWMRTEGRATHETVQGLQAVVREQQARLEAQEAVIGRTARELHRLSNLVKSLVEHIGTSDLAPLCGAPAAAVADDDWPSLEPLLDGMPGRGLVYVAGGFDDSGTLPLVEVYDPTLDTWRKVSPLRFKRKYFNMASVCGKLFAVGGHDGRSYLNTAEVYDPMANSWRTTTPMPTRRSGVGVVCVGGNVFAIGGGKGQTCYNIVEVLDPDAERWVPQAAMAERRSGAAVCALDGYIYACGGFDGSTYLSSVERYCIASGSWECLPAMSCPRAYAGCATLAGCVYVIGGWDGTTFFNTAEKYDPITNSWLPVPPMFCSRCDTAAVSIQGCILAIGGYNGDSVLDMVEKFDPLSGTWTRATSMFQQRRAHAAVAL